MRAKVEAVFLGDRPREHPRGTQMLLRVLVTASCFLACYSEIKIIRLVQKGLAMDELLSQAWMPHEQAAAAILVSFWGFFVILLLVAILVLLVMIFRKL